MKLKAYLFGALTICFGLQIQLSHATDLPSEITLATTDWCPYVCPTESDQPSSVVTEGIVVELFTEIFARKNIKLKIKNFPWTYSIRKANEGIEIDGLLTAVFEEAPELEFTTTPTMTYQVCMFGPSDLDWTFSPTKTQADLKTHIGGHRIGIIDGYGYNPVFDRFAANSENRSYIERVSGQNGLEILVRFAERYRISAFPSDKLVLSWFMRNSDNQTELKNVGCFEENPFYLAINPKKSWHPEVIQLLDQALKTPATRKRLAELVEKYTAY